MKLVPELWKMTVLFQSLQALMARGGLGAGHQKVDSLLQPQLIQEKF